MTKYVIDDGSLSSKVLQHEIQGTVIKVKPYTKIDEWLVDIIEEDDEIKFIYLPFCSGDLVRPDIDIRTDIATALHNYPQIRIIMPYEQMDKPSIERKASDYQIEKILKDNKDKITQIDFKSTATATNTNFSKYSVGGNDSLRSDKAKPDLVTVGDNPSGRESVSINPFKKTIEDYKNKRRRKK